METVHGTMMRKIHPAPNTLRRIDMVMGERACRSAQESINAPKKRKPSRLIVLQCLHVHCSPANLCTNFRRASAESNAVASVEMSSAFMCFILSLCISVELEEEGEQLAKDEPPNPRTFPIPIYHKDMQMSICEKETAMV